MAYPNTSAQDLAEKQHEIEQLHALLKRFYSAAQIGASMEDPTSDEIEEYTNHMQGLMRQAEELLPELTDEAEQVLQTPNDPLPLVSEGERFGWDLL